MMRRLHCRDCEKLPYLNQQLSKSDHQYWGGKGHTAEINSFIYIIQLYIYAKTANKNKVTINNIKN